MTICPKCGYARREHDAGVHPDAQLRALPLIGGGEDDHDWWNLLVMAGKLDHADRYASLCFFIGACVLLGSNAWGAYLLSIEFLGRTRPRHPVEEPLR